MRGGGLRTALQVPEPGPGTEGRRPRVGTSHGPLELDRPASEASPPGVLSNSHDHWEPRMVTCNVEMTAGLPDRAL